MKVLNICMLIVASALIAGCASGGNAISKHGNATGGAGGTSNPEVKLECPKVPGL